MKGPLSGIRVVELAQFAAGPALGLLLADMGADVIKVEPPEGDPTRSRSLYDVRGQSAYFMHFNRGKRSVVLDLKSPQGKQSLLDLLIRVDAFVTNLRPGKLEKLGLDYSSLQRLNARLVMTTVTGFGWDSPQRDLPSFDALAQAVSGLMSVTGEPGQAPVIAGTTIGDLSGAMFGAMGTLGALVNRGVTGKGQHVDVGMADSMAWLMGYPAAYYFASGVVPGPLGSGHENASPYGAYPTSDGKYLFVAAHHLWETFCSLIGLPALVHDERFRDRKGRLQHRAALDEAVRGVFVKRTRAEWQTLLESADIPCAPVNNVAEAFAEPSLRARGMRVRALHPDGGNYDAVGNPVKFSCASGESGPAPLLGGDTENILLSVAGYDAERVASLLSSRAAAAAR